MATGGSQCGFCTPGIVMRLAALDRRPVPVPTGTRGRPGPAGPPVPVHRLADHRGGRRAVLDARRPGEPRPRPDRDLDRAAVRAGIEGGVPQRVGPAVVLGDAGFADDGCPPDALVAVPDGRGGYAVAESLAEARARAGKVQGRSTSLPLGHPVDGARGPVGPHPADHLGGAGLRRARRLVVPTRREPASPYGNGGAFGGKLHSPVAGGRPSAGRRATAARCGSSGRGRTWCAWGPNARRWPLGSTADGSGRPAGRGPPRRRRPGPAGPR